jgi:hypothetical protein
LVKAKQITKRRKASRILYKIYDMCTVSHPPGTQQHKHYIYIPAPNNPYSPQPTENICVYVYNTNLSAYENKRKRKKKYEKQSLMESLEYLFRQRYNTWNILILTKLLLLLCRITCRLI